MKQNFLKTPSFILKCKYLSIFILKEQNFILVIYIEHKLLVIYTENKLLMICTKHRLLVICTEQTTGDLHRKLLVIYT